MLDGETRVVGVVGWDLQLILEQLDAKDVGQVDDGCIPAGQGTQAEGVWGRDVRGDCP